MSISNSQGTPFARNLNVVKMYFKKPLTLAFCIVSLASFLLTIVTSAQVNAALGEIASLLSATSGEDIAVSGGSNIFSYLISGVALFCFIMIYMFSKTDKGNPSIFFSILHVFSVIAFVIIVIVSILWAVIGLIAIFSIESLVTQAAETIAGGAVIDTAQLEVVVSSYRLSLIFFYIGSLVGVGIILFFYNSQNAFLKSCKRSCNEPSLFTKGAKPYSILCYVEAGVQLVAFVVLVLMLKAPAGDDADLMMIIPSELVSIILTGPIIVLFALNPISFILKGMLAKGWISFAAENENYVYAAAAAATRSPETNPIATFKAVERTSNNAIKQNQAYLYGEEENKDPAKKSSYIPEELQQDYSAQQYDPTQFVAPMQFDPQYAQQPQDPFIQPMQQDPFAQSPMVYGQPPMQEPFQDPYNNGMM